MNQSYNLPILLKGQDVININASITCPEDQVILIINIYAQVQHSDAVGTASLMLRVYNINNDILYEYEMPSEIPGLVPKLVNLLPNYNTVVNFWNAYQRPLPYPLIVKGGIVTLQLISAGLPITIANFRLYGILLNTN